MIHTNFQIAKDYKYCVHYNNQIKKPNRVHCFMWLPLENVAQPQKTKTLSITFEQMPLHAEDQCLFCTWDFL